MIGSDTGRQYLRTLEVILSIPGALFDVDLNWRQVVRKQSFQDRKHNEPDRLSTQKSFVYLAEIGD